MWFEEVRVWLDVGGGCLKVRVWSEFSVACWLGLGSLFVRSVFIV